ncbi:MAG: bifunctional enoyl-CoA hydratase/phosphate acetyltransferase [Victivallales bacterium]|nr:bifunctional enoyl-CoA hydratase/phosphate acetyltransferase [Victivallales bacterium]
MAKNLNELIELSKSKGTRNIAVVNADDLDVLTSLRQASREKIVKPVLFGNEKNIKKKLKENDYTYDCEIIDCKSDEECAEKAVKTIREGNAHMLMKGLVSSAVFMKAALNKEWGLSHNKLLSHITFVITENKKAFLLTDAGINIAPTLNEKQAITENAVSVAHKLGIEIPIVVPVCAVETVNQKMPATIDAAILSKMSERGQIKGCIIDGPLALDNAISLEAAKHKKISSAGAGLADIILAPNIESGNIIYKALAYYIAHTQMAAVVAGATVPIVLTSRADPPETKYNSIIFATAVS